MATLTTIQPAIRPPDSAAIPFDRRGSASGLPPFVGLVMQTTLACNLRCSYCFTRQHSPVKMSHTIADSVICDVLSDPTVQVASFHWIGGEPMLTPLAFYEDVLSIQDLYRRPGQTVRNEVSTNGTLVSPKWIRFLAANKFAVTVSLDGLPETHNANRPFANGRGSANAAIAGIRAIQQAGIRLCIDLVVTPQVIDTEPRAVLDFLCELGVRDVCMRYLLPPPNSPSLACGGTVVPFSRYASFLEGVFKAWWPAYTQTLKIAELSSLVEKVQGRPAGTCTWTGVCLGSVFTVSPGGDVSTCDNFLHDPRHALGNIANNRLGQIARDGHLISLKGTQRRQLEELSVCKWFKVCRGGCPRHREVRSETAEHTSGCCGLSGLMETIASAAAQGRN